MSAPNRLLAEQHELLADTQSFRPQLLALLSDDDLRYALPGNMTLGELCREMGEIEQGYVDSFREFKHRWGYRHPDATVATSIAALTAWYASLDAALLAALEAVTDDDLATRRVRGDWASIEKELSLYREALLMFYAKAGVYLRALGKPLSEEWLDWMG